MAKGKKEYSDKFLFEPLKFLMATASWSDEEVGIYARLLFHNWDQEGIPKNFTKMSNLISGSTRRLKSKWPLVGPKFEEKPGDSKKLINQKLEDVRVKQIIKFKELSKKGREAAQARWGKTTNTKGNAKGNAIGIKKTCQGQCLDDADQDQDHVIDSFTNVKESGQVPFHFEFHVSDFLDDILKEAELVNQISIRYSKKNYEDFNVYEFIQYWINKKIHPAAILDALIGLRTYWGTIDNPWSYGKTIAERQSGNYHEANHVEQHQEFKEAFDIDPRIRELLKTIGK